MNIINDGLVATITKHLDTAQHSIATAQKLLLKYSGGDSHARDTSEDRLAELVIQLNRYFSAESERLDSESHYWSDVEWICNRILNNEHCTADYEWALKLRDNAVQHQLEISDALRQLYGCHEDLDG
ncbi:MAG TPA: hypothetical protein VJ124_15700 [Pyrinomonadaceae bacterium]|nr:hypothetical protein [Pyrinomonadaceae bacterium]